MIFLRMFAVPADVTFVKNGRYWSVSTLSTFHVFHIFSIAKMELRHALYLALFAQHATAQNATVQPPGVSLPVAATCGPTSANIVCIDRYASILPYHFFRRPSQNTTDISFGQTSVPSDPSFKLVGGADFLVFDEARAFEILGPAPTYDLVFEVSDAVHEAPVYVPGVNLLYLSQLAPPTGMVHVDAIWEVSELTIST